MVVKNMNDLNIALQKELTKAMNIIAGQILEEMQNSIDDFYSGGYPKMYERTNKLRETPNITDIKTQGNNISFEAYLNTNYQYTSGKKPNMLQVLLLTNDEKTNQSDIGRLRKAVGSPHYWDRVLERMKQICNNVLSDFFT